MVCILAHLRYDLFHMLFGAHVSIAGGIFHAPENAAALGCETFQMFTRSPQGGIAPPLTDRVLHTFFANVKKYGLTDWVVHAPYYINLANADTRIRHNSIRLIREELERASLLQAASVMFHPGSAGSVGQKQAMSFVTDGITRVLDGYSGSARLLIEISAGAGMVIGKTFEEIYKILVGVGHPELGVCFDTAHAFASGYDLRDKRSVDKTLGQFDEIIGLKRLKMLHCNDSKVRLNEKKDRHEHLGKGFIGLDGFRAIIKHPKLQKLNFYLETKPDGVAKDLAILKKLRK